MGERSFGEQELARIVEQQRQEDTGAEQETECCMCHQRVRCTYQPTGLLWHKAYAWFCPACWAIVEETDSGQRAGAEREREPGAGAGAGERTAHPFVIEHKGGRPARSFGTLYPLGYAAPGSQARLEQLMAEQATVLVDVRLVPFAHNRPRWSRLGPSGLQKRWGARYVVLVDPASGKNALGNQNYHRRGAPVSLVNAELGLRAVLDLLAQERNVVLLCGCLHYEHCHRRTIVDLLLAKQPDITVILESGQEQEGADGQAQ